MSLNKSSEFGALGYAESQRARAGLRLDKKSAMWRTHSACSRASPAELPNSSARC
ncbi:uncharacterized protein L969DRAFT_45516 [Mixia osmundae IAM 14324]|uniref:Uncharacterized protein n=1 Tax=Mixia osmundae (strain CBS 9802 / IAM 14324 / JCM 22182 / KY 12970) TaxID=764103 RepID=G7DY14_MIXOS|nr:uncharacterized protein L969DRAFT_45516 [Mixia osmundae IAM 14324]KEI41375.1 hypothetical protein L969DRAFT_45516 [Mixia osmundae IAM 14324]GAA95474.1 hypothetical protein E5Q_02128 [Mixia osmundae IAM 14324]